MRRALVAPDTVVRERRGAVARGARSARGVAGAGRGAPRRGDATRRGRGERDRGSARDRRGDPHAPGGSRRGRMPTRRALLEAEIEGAPEAFRLATARLLGSLGVYAGTSAASSCCSRIRARAYGAPPSRPRPHRSGDSSSRCACARRRGAVGSHRGGHRTGAGSETRRSLADLASLMDDAEPRVGAAALRGLARWVQVADNEEPRGRALLLLSGGARARGRFGPRGARRTDGIGGEDAVALARGALAEPRCCEIVEAAVACVGHARWPRVADAAASLARARALERAGARGAGHGGAPSGAGHTGPDPPAGGERDEFVRAAILTRAATLESH